VSRCAALSYVFKNAKMLGVGTGNFHWHPRSRILWGDALPPPPVVVTAYTAHSEVGPHEPPTFAVVGEQDGIAPPRNGTANLSSAQSRNSGLIHRFENLEHGFGWARAQTLRDGWTAPSDSGNGSSSRSVLRASEIHREEPWTSPMKWSVE